MNNRPSSDEPSFGEACKVFLDYERCDKGGKELIVGIYGGNEV